jgi:hypothetical protein
MKTIWKYDVLIKDDMQISMPKDAKVLTVQTQQGVPCMWAEVESANDKVERYFKWFGTGHPIPIDLDLKYIGTVLLMRDGLVFHLYEKL